MGQLPDVVNGTLIRRKRSDLRIELRRAGLFHNITPNASPDKRRLCSCRSSALQKDRPCSLINKYLAGITTMARFLQTPNLFNVRNCKPGPVSDNEIYPLSSCQGRIRRCLSTPGFMVHHNIGQLISHVFRRRSLPGSCRPFLQNYTIERPTTH
ncbi:uncharacterized protein [Bombus flavifrons]|uniref:uncharacterized protein n=1 Tax=Bombus flavifrons TaxID=103934 RepID=UPI0037043EA4